MKSIAPERQNVQLPGSGSRVSQPSTSRYQAADRSKSCTARTGLEFRTSTSRVFHALRRWMLGVLQVTCRSGCRNVREQLVAHDATAKLSRRRGPVHTGGLLDPHGV